MDKRYVHSLCHPEAPTWAILDEQRECIRIECSECDAAIVTYTLTRDQAAHD